jgi:hypothetical protein
MKYLHFIPYVNRLDLTLLAIKSVPNFWSNTIFIDNSTEGSLQNLLAQEINFNFKVIKPPVPLTTAQTYNWIRKIAIEQDTDFITFMHNDCEVLTPEGDSLLLKNAARFFTDDSKTGWVHQDANENEDLFCAYRTSMLLDVGEWDWLCCPFYFLDIDFMRRVRSHGWTIEKTSGIMCRHHSDASSTIKSDKLRGLINPYYFSVSQNLMDFKWTRLGGDWSNLN